MESVEQLQHIKTILNILIKAKKDLDKTSKKRFDLGFTSSRKQTTTANARYTTDAEHYNKYYWKFKEEVEKI